MSNFTNPRDYVKKDKKVEKMLIASNGEMTDEITDMMLEDRGISFDKKGKPVMDANQFIKYAMSLTSARENASGIWFYNYKERHYDLLPYEHYKKIFFFIVEQASDTVWRSTMEKQYMAYFRNKVEQFQTSGTQAGVLQFNNCILDFSDGKTVAVKPSPEHFCNFRLPYDYDKDA